MPSFSDICVQSDAKRLFVKNKGINEKPITGAWEGLFIVDDDVRMSPTEVLIKDNWDDLVEQGKGIYIGKGKHSEVGDDPTFFTDEVYGVRIQTAKGTKIDEFRNILCSCVAASLRETLNGRSTRVFVQTTNGIVEGRSFQNATTGAVEAGGYAVSIEFSKQTIPTNDTPLKETIMNITFPDFDVEELNPFETKLPFKFAEIDQIEDTTSFVDPSVGTDGSQLSGSFTLTKDCNNQPLTGLVLADMEVTDENDNALTLVSLTETGSTGVYAFVVNTALTEVIFSSDGIIRVGGELYAIDPFNAEVTA